MRIRLSFLLLMCLFVLRLASANDMNVEVIPVYNRPAAELLPILTPLLAPDDRVVANGDSLIVKTSPERLQTLTNLVRKLDSPMTNLLISVIQSQDATAAELNAGLDGRISVPFNEPSAIRGRVGGFVNQSQGDKRNQNTQTIRTLDGQAAHIQAGNAFPVATYQASPPGSYGAPAMTQSTQYMEATTGFAVTPRLTGNHVTLAVSPWSDRLTGQGNLQVQEAETLIQANLGEWVEIGGVDETSRQYGAGVYHYGNQASQSRLRILVKVEVVN